jgi:hypothetical protein
MAIARYENITVNNVTNSVDDIGQYTTTITPWFQTRARVQDVHNALQITANERVYTDLVKLIVNYTPNTRTMVDNQPLYSITYRNQDWRITDCYESNDRMNVTFLCYRNDPIVPV